MSEVIRKKIYSRSFNAIVSGEKTFELRLADWDCQPGDILELVEISEDTHEATSRVLRRKIGSISRTKDMKYWPAEDVKTYGYQILSLLPEDAAVPSRQFSELTTLATKVRDHYNELNEADGKAKWDAQDRMAGFVGDVGALSKLIMVKHGLRRGPENIDEELAHELSDNLWSILVIADELGIDLEKSFVDAMEQLHTRIEAEKTDESRWERAA